jgi:hypothetical protein
MLASMDTTACEIQPCTEPVHTGYPTIDNGRWVPVCRPHLDELAVDWKLRATALSR